MPAVIKIKRKYWHTATRRFWGTLFTLIIALAVCVQLARQAFPLLQDYQNDITDYFGNKLGMIIEVESIDATWKGLRPRLSLTSIVVKSLEGKLVFSIDEATAELSLVSSLWSQRFSWRQLKFDGFNTRLVQAESGEWSIPGMPDFSKKTSPENENKDRRAIKDPYDVFLFGRRINITQARFALEYYSGDATEITIPEISIENDKDFHRIKASLDIAEAEAFSLVIEGRGDPREEDFIADGYLELHQFSTQDVVRALALTDKIEIDENHRVDVKLWFSSDANKGGTLYGELNARGALSLPGKKLRLPRQVNAKLYGSSSKDRDWELSLADLQMSWDGMSSPVLDLSLYGKARKFIGVTIKQLDVKPWVDLVLAMDLENEKVENIIASLAPSGQLKKLDIQITDKASGYFQATARVENGSSLPFLDAPGFKNINGYVSSSLFSGTGSIISKDGFTINLPNVYHDPLYFAEAQGQVSWKIDINKHMAYVSSGLLTVKNPEEEGRGYLHLSLPFSKQYGEPKMTLAIGIKKTLAKNHKKYVPKIIPKNLYQWLGTSIKNGQVFNAKFLYHGSLASNAIVSPTMQIHGEVFDGDLVFDPNWPELNGVSGQLTLDNQNLDVHLDQASLMGNSVFDASVTLVDDQTQDGLALSIKGSLASDAKTAMKLLKSSPIKKHIGSTFDKWEFSGGVAAKVELIIPLSSDSLGLSHLIEVNFSNAQIEMPDLDLNIKNIAGKLYYQTEKGVYADNLTGNIWERPFNAAISGQSNGEYGQNTVIDFSGRVSIADMYRWTGRPELKFSNGESTVLGNIIIPSEKSPEPLEVNVSSPLVGIELELPKPFYKPADKPIQFKSQLRFYDDGEEYKFTFDKQLRVTVFNSRDQVTSANFEVNNFDPDLKVSEHLNDTGVFNISGRMDHFELDVWIKAKDRYFSYFSAEMAEEMAADEGDSLAVELDVILDKFVLGSFEIDNLKVSGSRQAPYWLLDIESQMMTGKVTVPENDRPIGLDLKYVRLESDEDSGGDNEEHKENKLKNGELPVSVLSEIDLSDAVDVDFASDEFSVDEKNYGSWSFKLRVIDGGVVAHDIHAITQGMQIGTEEDGAEFVWLHDENGQNSQFTGKIVAANLADVFEAWDQDKLLESKSAHIDIDAQWRGAPDQVTLKTVEGRITLDIEKGSFNRGAGSDESALLRLLALFNFDTILRRLRLDFSDLAAQGYSYDTINGSLDFKNGKIYLTEPLIVESSSSYVQLVGTIDVVKETLDTDMVVTLPLASSAAFATAIVVNLPAAIGLYVMSKLFKKQLDRVSSMNVGVKGRWDDPKVKVKKIFDIDAAQRRGEEIKEERAQETAKELSLNAAEALNEPDADVDGVNKN